MGVIALSLVFCMYFTVVSWAGVRGKIRPGVETILLAKEKWITKLSEVEAAQHQWPDLMKNELVCQKDLIAFSRL